MPKTSKTDSFIHKTITIRADQAAFIEETSLNLSKFVQKKLDETMKR